MATFGLAENLSVLVIDDQASRVLAELGAAASMQLDFSYIDSWAQAQKLCATSGDMGGADILLIDLSFDTDLDLEKVIDGPTRILPVGPLLALPYIGKHPVMSCVCYSAHIANPRLQENPWFLIAMGLILARSEGIPLGATGLHSHYLSGGSGTKHLDREIKRLAQLGYASQNAALYAGLEGYRDNLMEAISKKSVTLVNRHSILRALESIGEPANFKALVSALGSESVQLVGNNWKRALNLRSLFANILRPSDAWEVADALREIRQWFDDIPSPTPLERALQLMSAQDGVGKIQPIKERILELAGRHVPCAELTETLRLCVLFANIRAIEEAEEKELITKVSILHQLGDKMDVNTYFGWFGERKKASNTPDGSPPLQIKPPTGKCGTFSQLDPLSRGADKFARCFLTPRVSEITLVDHEAIAKYCQYEGFDERRSPLFHIIPKHGESFSI